MKYIVRSCKKCIEYSPEWDVNDDCILCRRYYPDRFKAVPLTMKQAGDATEKAIQDTKDWIDSL